MPTAEISARATRVAEYSKERITYGGVDYVELAVDTETGRVHIEKVFGAHDCGRPINPQVSSARSTAASCKASPMLSLSNALWTAMPATC